MVEILLYLACPAFLWHAEDVDQLSHVLDRSSPNIQDRYIHGWAIGHDQSDLFRDRLRDVATVTDVSRESAKIGWHISPSFGALAFHKGSEDRNMDAGTNTADNPQRVHVIKIR